MFWNFKEPFWFYPKPIDFRKQIDGLMLLVADQLAQDPTSGHLFVFRNRQANKLKLLWWDRHGFWLFYKRIERGRFKLPAINDETLSLTPAELSALLIGLDFTKQTYLPEVGAKYFF